MIEDVGDQRRSLARLLASAAANRFYQQFAMLLILVFTARWLGPDGRGLLASAMAWVQLVGTAAGLSLGKVAFEQAGMDRGSARDAGLVYSMIALSSALLAILLIAYMCAYAAAGARVDETSLLIFAFVVLSVPFYIWEDFAFYLFTLRLRLIQNYGIVSLGRTCSVALVLLLVGVLKFDLLGALAAVFIGQVTSSVWTFCIIRKDISGQTLPRKAVVRALLGKSLRIHPQTLAMMLFGTSDVVMLFAFRGESEAAYYQMAWALVAIPVFASTPIGNVLFQLIAERGPDGAWIAQKKLIMVSMGVAVAIGGLAACIAPLAIPIVFGEAYGQASAIFLGLIPFGFARVLTNLMTPQWIGRGLFERFSVATVVIAGATLAMNLFLIPERGAWGAVQASWLAALGLFTINAALAIWISVRVSSVSSADGDRSQ